MSKIPELRLQFRRLTLSKLCVRLVASLSIFLLYTSPIFAQATGDIEELKRLLRETQESMEQIISEHQAQIDALQKRIEELEQQAIESEKAQENLEEELVQQDVKTGELQSSLFGRITIHGYYEVQYLAADSSVVDSFVQNELSIFLRHETEDDKWTFFSELEFELFDGDEFFFEDAEDESEFEIETAWLEYRLRDSVRLRAGKHLLPQYWQTYHYPNLTLSTRPPSMVGRVFPKDLIGVEARGDVWLEQERGFSYVVYVGNGGDTDISEVDTNEGEAVGGRLTTHLSRGGIFDTFDVSVSAYSGRDEENDSENVFGLDGQIRFRKFELLSELAIGDQVVSVPVVGEPDDRIRSDTIGYYIQAAYNVAPRWHLFYRFDELDQLEHDDGPFDSEQHTLGVNFRPRANISLKFEIFRALLEGDRDSFNGLATSVVYNF